MLINDVWYLPYQLNPKTSHRFFYEMILNQTYVAMFKNRSNLNHLKANLINSNVFYV